MKLKIDFHYPIQYVPYRHQNSLTAFGAGEIVLDILEVTSSEAPVVFKIDNSEIRMMNGRYWVESLHKEAFLAEVNDPLKINSTPLAGGRDIVRLNMSMSGKKSLVETTTIEEIVRSNQKWVAGKLTSIRAEATVDDKGLAAKQWLLSQAAGLCFVDDRLFIECGEPALVFKLHSDRMEIGYKRPFSSFDVPYRQVFDTWSDNNYSASLKDASGLLAFCRENGLLKNKKTPHIEIVDARACRYDGVTHDVYQRVHMLLLSMRAEIRSLPREAIDIVFALSSILEQKADRLGSVSPRLISTLQELVDLVPASPLSVHSDYLRYQFSRGGVTKEDENLRVAGKESNFHAAAASSKFQSYQEMAGLIISRWENAVGFERLPYQTRADMVGKAGEFTVREFNTFWQIEMLAGRSGIDYEDLCYRIANEGQIFEVVVSGEPANHYAVAYNEHTGPVVLGSVPAVITENLKAAVFRYVYDDDARSDLEDVRVLDVAGIKS